MILGTLLNQNVQVELYDNTIKLINMSNGMELARFSSESMINAWGNPGGFMTKEDYDLYMEKRNEK